MSTNPQNQSEKRRFPRIHFRHDYGASDKITKAFVHWDNLEFSDVFDLSIGGLALSRPTLVEFKKDQVVHFHLELGEFAAFPVSAKVAWIRDFSVGFSFLRLEPQGHLTLRKFLNDKLVGSHLVLMSQDLYPKEADFDLWYSGPGESHIFLKKVAAAGPPHPIEHAEIVLDGDRIQVKNGKITSGNELKPKLIQILTHAPEDFVELKTLLDQVLAE